ncbi:MAG TPA: hypothetical protein VIY56_14030 [Vicinamibacterales bacterium]
MTVWGQPVYTLSLGLGVRLPLHGNLGASPAALLAPGLPAPLAHWLLLAAALTAAIVVVRAAIDPVGGTAMSWLAVLLLFGSAPMVAYTVYNDWPETAVTYCALVAGVFAPHAFLELRRIGHPERRLLGALGLGALIFGVVAASHPGYWPQLGGALAMSLALSLARPSHTVGERLRAALVVGTTAALGVLIHVPDVLREAALGAGLPRDTQGPTGELLLTHLFPLSDPGARLPFSLLPVAVVAIIGGLLVPRAWRPLVVASGVASIAFGIAASTLVPGSVAMAPSTTWTLRDAATVFAVLSAALATSLLVGRRTLSGPADTPPRRVRWGLATLLAVAAAQGPLYAASLLWTPPPEVGRPWNHDWRTAPARLAERGMPVASPPPGLRVALWAGGRTDMRAAGLASTDWADAGYAMVTSWTKNRTMAQLVRPNDVLFDQTTDLDTRVLCDPAAATFLQLRYLLMPPGASCEGWTVQPGVLVDGRWVVATRALDERVRTVSPGTVSAGLRSQPALGDDLALVHALVPQPGTSVAVASDHVSVTLADAARGGDVTVVLPVAYDTAWHTSSGHVESLGGLVAVSGADTDQFRVDFVPDPALRLRATGMRAAQVLSLLGLVALALAGRGQSGPAGPDISY